MPVIHWRENVVVLAGFSSLAALGVVKMTIFSAAGGGGLVGVAAFPLQWQWICTMIMFYPSPTDGRYSNGLWCLILLIYHMCLILIYTSFYILVSLISVLLRPTTSLLSLILSVPMCIDVTMCMLMLLFYDSCAMLALYVSIKFLLLIYTNMHLHSTKVGWGVSWITSGGYIQKKRINANGHCFPLTPMWCMVRYQSMCNMRYSYFILPSIIMWILATPCWLLIWSLHFNNAWNAGRRFRDDRKLKGQLDGNGSWSDSMIIR